MYMRRAKQTLKKHVKHVGYARWARALVALVLLSSLAIPAFSWIDGMKAYAISPKTEKVIGTANKNLSSKFSYDQQGNKWQFNKNGVALLAANIAKQQKGGDSEGVAGALSQLTAQQVGGGGKDDTSLYSVDLPTKAKQGITYYDNVNRLSFSMVPDFPMRDGKLVQDRVVYPFVDGGQIIYTAKANGLKEDIVLSKYIGDTLRYSYDLKLPDTLAAKLLSDGSIGIYSASPALYGNINLSNDQDKTRIMDARKNGTKDYLMFTIPAPFIKDQNGNAGHTKYLLNGNRLTVVADQLRNLAYPLTVDPSVTVTSSSEFTNNSNNEGMAAYDTSGQISRGGITGGTTGVWDNAGGTAFTTKRSSQGSVAYNGYLYVLGGQTSGGTRLSDVQYAAIDGNGNVGTWQPTSSFTNARANLQAVAYNGYMYILGGTSSGTSVLYNDVQYAPICDGDLNTGGCSAGAGNKGKLGTWRYTYNSASSGSFVNGFTSARYSHNVQIYNGYLYVMGGCTDTNSGLKTCQTIGSDVQYAAVNANGTVGTWTSANTGAAFTARYGFAAVTYNGYIYVMGGCTAVDGLGNCSTLTNATQYAAINSTGTLGAWATSATTFTTARYQFSATVYNGYIYISGGNATYNDVQYAPINANGTLGTWLSTTTFNTGGRFDHVMTQYSGYLYITGGCDSNAAGCNSGNNYLTDTRKAKVDTAGVTSSYSAAANYDATTPRTAFATATYGNYIYVIGGNANTTGGGGVGTTRYAQMAADGSLTWNTTSSNFNNLSGGSHGCAGAGSCPGRIGLAAAAYNGYLYIAGGNSSGGATTDWSDVQSAVICTAANVPVVGCVGPGDLRNWTTIFADYTNNSMTYTSTNGRGHSAMVIYNGVMYIIGGANAGGTTLYSQIYQSTLTTTGGAGNFSLATTGLPSGAGRKGVKAFVASNKLYIMGGGNGGGWSSKIGNEPNDAQFIPINASGALDNVTGWKDANAAINGGSGSSFLAAGNLDSHTATVSNGQVYVASGLNSSGIAQTVVYRAVINANGSLGSWSTTAAYSGIRYGTGALVVNGFLYIIGGCSQANILGTIDCNSPGQILNDYQYTRINNGGSGTTGSWTAQTTSGAGRADHGATEYNGYLYVVGGCTSKGISTAHACSGITPDTRYASIASDGTIGAWTAGTALPADRGGLVSLTYNGYIYAIGGCLASGTNACTSYSNNVLYAPICDGVLNTNGCTAGAGNIGKIGNWSQAGTFTTGRFGHSAVIYNGYMYVMNGCSDMSGTQNCTTFQSDVQYAAINSNGTVGSNALGTGTFSSAGGLSAPSSRFKQSAVAYGGRLYILGGCSAMASGNCTAIQADVSVISIAANGTLTGSWATDRALPTARYGSSAIGYNGYLYMVGGCTASSGGNCTGNLGEIQAAPVLSSGSLGAWDRSVSDFASPGRFGQGAVMAKGYLVITGGNEATNTFVTQSRIAPVTVQSRVGKYSKLLSISPTTDVAGVYYNGTLPFGSSVIYKVAPSSGAFGAITSAVQGTGSEPTPMCGLGDIYYVQLMATIDDSTTATFPESTAGNVTDFTVYYRLSATPPPNLRMTGGKWFYNEQPRPLDTCKQ